MSLRENPLVKKFISVFAYTGYLDWFIDERDPNDAILISSPSNICGIVYTDKITEKCKEYTGWKNYHYNGFKPNKKDTNYVLFEGNFYSCDFVIKTFNIFFKNKDTFDIRVVSVPENDYHAMLIKIDGTFSIGIANLKNLAIKEEKGGVLFIKTEFKGDPDNDSLEEYEISRTFIKWKNGKAVFEDTWRGSKWNKVVYNQDYLFDKQEEIGDSLLI